MGVYQMDDPQLRLQRAQEHIDALEVEVAAFFDREPYTFSFKDEPGSGDRVYYVHVHEDPPSRLAVIAGDCIHNLRSALDHLAWQLALLTTPRPNDRTEFVICETAATWTRAKWKIKNLPVGARWLVETFQPYNIDVPEDHILLILHRMWIHDKHRSLTVIGRAVPYAGTFGLIGAASESRLITKPIDGDGEIGRITGVPDGFKHYLDADLTLEVAFGPGGAADELPVVRLLKSMHEFLAGDLMPKFARFFR